MKAQNYNYDALKKGHTLQIWRRSQPFNWFIQDNNNTVYHSESGQGEVHI